MSNLAGLYQKNAKILILGLDNAGKTSLLYIIKEGRIALRPPTLHPSMWILSSSLITAADLEELIVGKIRFKAFDLGGHEIGRILDSHY